MVGWSAGYANYPPWTGFDPPAEMLGDGTGYRSAVTMPIGYPRYSTDQRYFTAPRPGPDVAGVNFDPNDVDHDSATKLWRAVRHSSAELVDLCGLDQSTIYRTSRRGGSTSDLTAAAR